MHWGVLGPLEVRRDDGALVDVPGGKERLLLAVLAAASPDVVSVDRLAEQLWDGDPPRSARKALQGHVVRLRTALEPDRPPGSPGRFVVRRGQGYALALDREALDATAFTDRVSRGRAQLSAGDAEGADALLGEALGLWRGAPFADWPDTADLQRERVRLEAVRVHAVEAWWSAELALGRHAEAVPDLERLAEAEPVHEGWWALLVVALYRCGRQGAALDTLRRARAALAEELGVDPGPRLRELEQAVLAQDPVLDLHPGPEPALARPDARADARPDARPVPITGCPYKGLATYDVDDAAVFHGRERLVRTLVTALVDHPVVLVSGSSGAGKSSVVRAGLLPALGSGALPGSGRWRPEVVVPGTRPVDTLASLTGEDLPEQPVVLVCDQLEQLWSPDVPAGERVAFLDGALGLVDDGVVARCVLVVRGDHVGRLAEHGDLAQRMLGALVMVPPMTEVELRDVVAEPARSAGLEVEEELTDLAVRDVIGRSGALPLLSTALAQTWERRREGTLPLAGYLASGGVVGAVARSAEQVYATLTDDEREQARWVMVRLAEQDPDGTLRARRLPQAELETAYDPTGTRRVVEALVTARLVARADHHLEVAHEALLGAWPRLAAWLGEDAVGRSIRRHLAPAALEWHDHGRPTDELYRGARLEAAAEWAADPDAGPTEVEREFVEAGLAQAEAELTAARERAEAEAAGRRRTRRFAGVLAGALVLALVATVVAVLFQRRADDRAAEAQAAGTVADANRLAALSASARSLDLSMLLAAAAVETADTPATRDGLLDTLVEHRRADRVFQLGLDKVQETALSANGRTMAAVVLAGQPQLLAWAPGSTRAPKVLENWWQMPESVAVSPDGRTVVGAPGIADPSWGVRAYAPDGTKQRVLRPRDLGGLPRDVVYTRTGRLLIFMVRPRDRGPGVEGKVAEIDLDTGSVRPILTIGRTRLPDTFETYLTGSFAEDASSLVVYPNDQTRALRLDLDTESVTRIRLEPRDTTSLYLLALPDLTAQAWSDGAVTLYDDTGRAVQTLDVHRAPVRDVRVLPDGRTGVTVGDGGQVELWDIDPRTGRWSLGESLVGHSTTAWQIEASTAGRSMLTVSSDGQVVSWDLTDDAGLASAYPGLEDRWVSNKIGVVDPGRLVVAPTRTLSEEPRAFNTAAGPGTESVAAVFLDPRTGRVVDEVVVGDTGAGAVFGSSATVSPDARRVAVTYSFEAAIIDTRTREVIARIPAPRGELLGNGAAWTPDGSRLLLGAEGFPRAPLLVVDTATWKVTDRITTGACVEPEPCWGGPVFGMQWAPDGQTLAAAFNIGHGIHVFDAALRRRTSVDLGGGGDAWDLSYSPDGRYLAAGRESGVLSVLDTETWRPVHEPARVHGQPVLDVEWLPDSNTVVTTGKDETVSLYDVERDLVRSRALPASDDPGDGSTFLMPGPTEDVVVFNEGGPGYRYPLDPARWLAQACTVAGRDLTQAEWDRYLPDRPYRPVCDLSRSQQAGPLP